MPLDDAACCVPERNYVDVNFVAHRCTFLGKERGPFLAPGPEM
jgi:hypothetical protein